MLGAILISLILGAGFSSFYYIYHFNDDIKFLKAKTVSLALAIAMFFLVIALN